MQNAGMAVHRSMQNAETVRVAGAGGGTFSRGSRTAQRLQCLCTVRLVRPWLFGLPLAFLPAIVAAQTPAPGLDGIIRRPVTQHLGPASAEGTGGPITTEQAVAQAIEHNLGLLADRFNLTIADARLVTARLRPNPVLSIEGDHLDWLGTGYNRINNAGPPEFSVRTDFLLEGGSKRARRIEVAGSGQDVA